jgi:hypothetical protein
MCPSVTYVRESRLIMWDPLGIYNPWAFSSGNRKTSAWTSLCLCLAPWVGITQYGSLWTAWLSRPISYPYPPPTGSDSMPSSTYHMLSAITASWRPSSLTEDPSLLLAFENNYTCVWVPISSRAQPIILRLMDILSEFTISSKICSVLVFWQMVWSGTSIFH